MSTLRHAYVVLMRIVDWVLIGLTAILATIVPLGVFFRYVVHKSLTFTDEMGGFLLAWITFLGCVAALDKGTHLGFEQITDSLPRPIRNTVRVIIDLLLACIFLVFAVDGTKVAKAMMIQVAVTLPIPFGLIYAILPVSGVLMLIVLIAKYTGIKEQSAAALAKGDKTE